MLKFDDARGNPASPEILQGPVVPSSRWVRVKFAGVTLADSRRPLLLRQYGGPGMLPTYFFPQADVRMDLLMDPRLADTPRGPAQYWTVRVGDRAAEAAWTYLEPPQDLAPLKGAFTFDWEKMDAWYEEEEQIFAHARDPYHRVDVLASSRHVRVVIDGVAIADSQRPFLLFETGLPARFYIPQEDIRMDLLRPTSLTSRCPYKGLASYWSAEVAGKTRQNIAWGYLDPIPENPKIKGLLSFYNERVDLYVDGELQPRPQTFWSEKHALV